MLIKGSSRVPVNFFNNLLKYKAFYLMAIPGILFFIVFKYIPMIGVTLAFKEFRPAMGVASILHGEWMGLDNFTKFFQSYFFSRVFFNTIIISSLKILFGFPAPIILALLINEVRRRQYKRFVQTVSYLPYFLSWVIVASIAYVLLSPTNGIINQILSMLGIRPVFFLGSTKYFRWIIVFSNIWRNTGWGSIIYLAAISGIDENMYEAAKIDGATRFQKMWYITLSSLKELISIMLILNIGTLLEAGFEEILLLYSPAVYEVADIIDTYVYREGLIKLDYSFATAVGLTKSIIAFILVIMSNRFAKKIDAGSLW